VGVPKLRIKHGRSDQVKRAAEAVEGDALSRVHEVHADPATPNTGNNAAPSGVGKTPLQKKAKRRNRPMNA